MKTKMTIHDLSHDDLVNFFSTALYESYKFGCNYDNVFYHSLPNASDDDCFEDKLAKILLAGGEIEIIDRYSEDEDEGHYGNNKKVYWDEEIQSTVYPITLEDIKNGLANAFDGNFVCHCDEYKWAKKAVAEMCSGDEADYDVDDAEMLLQIITYNEIVY